MAAKAKLIVVGPGVLGKEYIVDRTMTLGRDATNDIVLNEVRASRTHCRFVPSGGGIEVTDLQSSNGTKVNGVKVAQQTLKHGDVIHLGEFKIRFEEDPPPAQPLPVAASVAAPEIAPGPEEVREAAPAESAGHGAPPASLGIAAAVLIVACGVGAFLVLRPKDGDTGSREPAPVTKPGPVAVQPPKPELITELKPRPEDPVPPVEPETIAANTPDTPAAVTSAPVDKPLPAVNPVVQGPGDADGTKPGEIRAAAEAEFKKALAERDRALANGNFAGARAALTQYLNTQQPADKAAQAQAELKSTEEVIGTALGTLLEEATRAADGKKYRLAVARSTRLLAADPEGRAGKAAQALLNRIDSESEPRFKTLAAKADAALKSGQFDAAAESLDQGLAELGGTKWAEALGRTHLQALLAKRLIRSLEETRAKRAAAGRPVMLNLPTKKLNAPLAGVSGAGLRVASAGLEVTLSFRELAAADADALFAELGGAQMAAEQYAFWMLLQKPAQAQAALEKALAVPEQAAVALRLSAGAGAAGGVKLKHYDFGTWQQQTDWDALSGSWSTQGDRYVLENADGGDTALKPAVLDGLSLGAMKLSFDAELSGMQAGWFFSVECGTEQRAVALTFTAAGAALNANLGEPVVERFEWKPGPLHVELTAVDGQLTIAVNGTGQRTVPVPGLKELSGTVTFRARETAAAIDNVQIRPMP